MWSSKENERPKSLMAGEDCLTRGPTHRGGIVMMDPTLSFGAGTRNICETSEMVFPYGTDEQPLYILNLNGVKKIRRRKVG
jgi:hypothetical protein